MAVRLRTGMAMVALSRSVSGGALLLVGVVFGAAGQIGDFGVLARAIAIAHLATPFTDVGGLAAFTARSADPIVADLRHACRWWLARRVGLRTVVLAPVVAAVAPIFDVPLAPAVVVFVALAAQRLAAELLRSDGRIVEYATTSGLPSALWLLACLVVVALGSEPTAGEVTLLYAALVAVVAAAALTMVLGADGGPAAMPEPAIDDAMSGRRGLFVEGLLEAAVRNVDVVLVALVVGRDEAGLYAVASRLVAVAMTPLAAANGALAREYAERWAVGGPAVLTALARSVARRIAWFPAASTLVAGIVAVAIGDDGGVGTVAQVAAVLLAAATISTAAGSAGLLLGICRHEVPSAWISAVAISGSILLLLSFGSIGGLIPAAIGFAIGVAGQNIAQAWYLRRAVGVVSHA